MTNRVLGSALTDFEVEILTLLASGLSSGDAAMRLEISKPVLASHMADARMRVGARTTTELVVRFLSSISSKRIAPTVAPGSIRS